MVRGELVAVQLKICLIAPPREYLLQPKSLPPLGLMYVSSALKSIGHEVEVLDFADGWKFVDADCYGISVTTPDFPRSVEIARWIRDHNPDAKLIAGGPHATLCPNEFLENGFDVACVGDGEACVQKLNDGGIVEGWLKDIDAYHPDRDALNLWSYDFKIDGQRATTVLTARSCYWRKCKFCCRLPLPYDLPRYHSVGYVDEEITNIAGLGFPACMIYDDEFFSYPKRDREIIELLYSYGMLWRCFCKADLVLDHRELIAHASRNGLREVLVGFESFSNKILETINKGTTTEINYECAKFLHGLGIKVKASIVLGLPGESEETLEETWRGLERSERYIDKYDFTIFTPYQGSEVYKHPERFDIKFDKQDTYRAYKGMHAEGWEPPHISTSKLSFERIMEFREHLEERFKYGGREG